ncbi:uncharacterized protein BDR25DRAFT_354449 [Lindgomyces ingoldianus]|uniref:Uncharacterized protein n=1 Tax=Lindgomyces ingoldianus TaxID=673940 RepID=A0ACB6QXF0_9PLEO|nr:uncharacterized protein BDR25DRAFT_354449 [Lindgomyces ingoldianus]KAF2471190.1 hypothetical protein BDR25DRAFT_354449 [Lindgomyces ingoldianus]
MCLPFMAKSSALVAVCTCLLCPQLLPLRTRAFHHPQGASSQAISLFTPLTSPQSVALPLHCPQILSFVTSFHTTFRSSSHNSSPPPSNFTPASCNSFPIHFINSLPLVVAIISSVVIAFSTNLVSTAPMSGLIEGSTDADLAVTQSFHSWGMASRSVSCTETGHLCTAYSLFQACPLPHLRGKTWLAGCFQDHSEGQYQIRAVMLALFQRDCDPPNVYFDLTGPGSTNLAFPDGAFPKSCAWDSSSIVSSDETRIRLDMCIPCPPFIFFGEFRKVLDSWLRQGKHSLHLPYMEASSFDNFALLPAKAHRPAAFTFSSGSPSPQLQLTTAPTSSSTHPVNPSSSPSKRRTNMRFTTFALALGAAVSRAVGAPTEVTIPTVGMAWNAHGGKTTLYGIDQCVAVNFGEFANIQITKAVSCVFFTGEKCDGNSVTIDGPAKHVLQFSDSDGDGVMTYALCFLDWLSQVSRLLSMNDRWDSAQCAENDMMGAPVSMAGYSSSKPAVKFIVSFQLIAHFLNKNLNELLASL